jgi:hypothetical protein
MPYEFSILLMSQMDEVRKIAGITYPPEIESTDIPYGWKDI